MAKILSLLIRSMNLVGMYMVFVLMLLISAEVVMRYFFGSAIPGSIEMVQLTQIMMVGLCVAYTQRQKANVNVDLFTNMLPHRGQHLLALINSVIAAVVLGLMAYGIYKLSSTPGAMREVTDTLRIPLYPFRWVLAFGFAVLTLQLIADSINNFRLLVSNGDSEETHSAEVRT